jgi:hypothetical protein
MNRTTSDQADFKDRTSSTREVARDNASRNLLHEVHSDAAKAPQGKGASNERSTKTLEFDNSIYGGKDQQNKNSAEKTGQHHDAQHKGHAEEAARHHHHNHKPGATEQGHDKKHNGDHKSEAPQSAAERQNNVNKMLDSNTSQQDKVALAGKMYDHGQRSFQGADGKNYDINEGQKGDRKLVNVFSKDEHGKDQVALRGIVEKNGQVSQQKDSKGNDAGFESRYSSTHDGAGLRKAPEGTTNADKSITTTDAQGNKTVTSADKKTKTYTGADGKGYVRNENNNGFSETHTGPKPEDNFSIDHREDGKGNVRNVRDDGRGNTVETRNFPNSKDNFVMETNADKSTKLTDSKGVTTTTGDGKTTTFTGNDGTAYTRTKTGDDSYTEKHTGPKAEDNYTQDHSATEASTKDNYTYADSTKNYTKETTPDGKSTVTDSVGLQIKMQNASPEFRQKAYNEIEKMPANERKLLADKGIHYDVVNKMSDLDPNFAHQQPRGWKEGQTYDDADGMYMPGRKSVVVAENTNKGASERTDGVVHHETGHAVDNAVGDFSHSDEFKKAYDADVAKMPDKEKIQMDYLLQDGNAGKEETAAETYGALRGTSANPSQTEEVRQDWQNVTDAWKKKLAEMSK